jgi:small-conductance mechanosensitive channel
MVDVTTPLLNIANEVLTFLPVLIAAIIILIIGWIVGRVAGGVVSRLLKRTNADEAVAKTDLGKH